MALVDHAGEVGTGLFEIFVGAQELTQEFLRALPESGAPPVVIEPPAPAFAVINVRGIPAVPSSNADTEFGLTLFTPDGRDCI